MKICIVGAPSCRKSTTAHLLNSMLKVEGHNSNVCEEYARHYIMKYGQIKDPFEQLLILLKQTEREAELSKVHKIVICDSASWLGYIYSTMLISESSFGYSTKNRKLLKEIYSGALDQLKSYNKTFFMPVQESVVKDGVREQDDNARDLLQKKILGFLYLHDIDFHTVAGTVQEKAEYIKAQIVGGIA